MASAFDVFVSYLRHDQSFVRRLAEIGQADTSTDYTDIELGDWFIPNTPAMQWYEKDVGCGTINKGHIVHKKNLQ